MRTAGLQRYRQDELEFCFTDTRLEPMARELAHELVSYILANDTRIHDGEKVSWATSTIQFDRVGGHLRASALDVKSDTFAEPLDILLTTWRSQLDVCEEAGSPYTPPLLADMIVVSPGTLDAKPIADAVRYPFQAPNSGWWLFDSDHSGDISAMRRIHVANVLEARSDVTRYLALGAGYCFSQQPNLRVWFDSEAALRDPN